MCRTGAGQMQDDDEQREGERGGADHDQRRHDLQLGLSDWERASAATGGTLMGMRPAAAVLLVDPVGPVYQGQKTTRRGNL
jgi:hypothetical protein